MEEVRREERKSENEHLFAMHAGPHARRLYRRRLHLEEESARHFGHLRQWHLASPTGYMLSVCLHNALMDPFTARESDNRGAERVFV